MFTSSQMNKWMLGLDAYDPQPRVHGTNSGGALYMAFMEAYSPTVMFRPLSSSETHPGRWDCLTSAKLVHTTSHSGLFIKLVWYL